MKNFFNWIDRQMCVRLKPWQLRIWWQELWVREDEFHPSLDCDVRAVLLMSDEETVSYMQKLFERRDKAHQTDNEKCDQDLRKAKPITTTP